MKASILNNGGYFFMDTVELPITVECEISPSGNNIACTPEQLVAAGVQDVPTRFCCAVWYFKLNVDATIIEE